MSIIERHHDYVIPIGNVAAGQTIPQISFQTDTDAPFCLRSFGGWRLDRNDIAQAKMRYTDERQNWAMPNPIGCGRFGMMPGSTGKQALPQPQNPQRIYERGSNIWFQFTNASASDWTNVNLLMRGTKLYEEGQIYSPSYPPRYRTLESPTEVAMVFTANVQRLRNINLSLVGGYDFVMRGLMAKELVTSVQPAWSNLAIRLKDHWGQYYSNDYVQLDWLASSDYAQRPGLLYPEIYMSANDNFYIDAVRNDGGSTAALSVQLCFLGARVKGVSA